LNKNTVNEIVRRKLELEGTLGEKISGSGHLTYVSFQLVSYTISNINDNLLFQINFDYRLQIYTEFTIEPSNPPVEYIKNGSVIVDKNNNIIE